MGKAKYSPSARSLSNISSRLDKQSVYRNFINSDRNNQAYCDVLFHCAFSYLSDLAEGHYIVRPLSALRVKDSWVLTKLEVYKRRLAEDNGRKHRWPTCDRRSDRLKKLDTSLSDFISRFFVSSFNIRRPFGVIFIATSVCSTLLSPLCFRHANINTVKYWHCK